MILQGGPAAWRGYRLQALYSLSRILGISAESKQKFQPEGREDLDVLGSDDELIESIQIKAYTDKLTLSDLEPSKSSSFLHRTVELVNQNPTAQCKLVCFGTVGEELNGFWHDDPKQVASIRTKLQQHGFSIDEIEIIRTSIMLEMVDEAQLTEIILSKLSETLVGGNPEIAKELLSYWLYEASEQRLVITQDLILSKIVKVGEYIAERHAHSEEWFQSIVPVEAHDISSQHKQYLAETFYQGVNAQYEHILADADIRRDEKLTRIDEAFQQTQVVILHGASGQGKSTLAYRYLHEYVPNFRRFSIRNIADQHHALRIVHALEGQILAIDIPIVVFIDVSSRDRDWVLLVRDISYFPNIRILISIREEDWRRANISPADFRFESIDLQFEELEARVLFSSLALRKQSSTLLTFEDAWMRFGGQGPLLEFVYLITQNEILEARLAQQVRELQDSVRNGIVSPEEIRMLRWLAVVSAYQARLDTYRVVAQLKLLEPERTFQLFEKEYLLRRSSDGKYIEGLHPIRSTILCKYLTDDITNSWIELATASFATIAEEDLEIFLLHAFSRRFEHSSLIFEAIQSQQYTTWSGIGGVLRASLWLGVRKYVELNRALVDDVIDEFGYGWWVFLDSDVTDAGNKAIFRWWEDLKIVPIARKKQIESYWKRQTPKSTVLEFARRWLESRDTNLQNPLSHSDWSHLAEVMYWVYRLDLNQRFQSWISTDTLELGLSMLSVEQLGDVLWAVSYGNREDFQFWSEAKRPEILSRYCEQTRAMKIEDDGKLIRAHFIVSYREIYKQDQSQNKPKTLHDEALWHVELLHKLVPYREAYGCQGYGHNVLPFNSPVDDTTKSAIPVDNLLPSWAVMLNSLFHQLGNWSYRPKTWSEYSELIFELREIVIESFGNLQNALSTHFRKQKQIGITRKYILAEAWNDYRLVVSHPPMLPQCAVDEFGFTGEGQQSSTLNSGNIVNNTIKNSIALWQYRDYVELVRDYTQALAKFYEQSYQLITLYEQKIGIGENRLAADISLTSEEKHLAHLSKWNLADSLKYLARFQYEFKNHFAQYFNSEQLHQLENKENTSFEMMVSYWFQFANNPQKSLTISNDLAKKQCEVWRNEFIRHLVAQTNKLMAQGAELDVIRNDITWDGKKILWLKLDIVDPLQLFNVNSQLLEIIRVVTTKFNQANSHINYLLTYWFEDIAIIPIVAGKNLAAEVWRVYSQSFIRNESFDESHWFYRLLYPVPADVWNHLGIPCWDSYEFIQINELHSSVGRLLEQVTHLVDIHRCSDIQDEQIHLVKEYFDDHSQTLMQQFEQIWPILVRIMEWFSSYVENRSETDKTCKEIIELFNTIRSSLLPTEDFQGKTVLSSEQLNHWAKQLYETMGNIVAIRLGFVILQALV